MPLYKFKALDDNNCIIQSNINASTFNDAKQAIVEKGFTPIKIEENKGIENINISLFSKLKVQDLILFCRELSIIIKSGINLVVGLDVLQKQSSKELKRAVRDISTEIQKGRLLSSVMNESKYKFPDLLIKMISTGEKSGNLDSILENMADYYERESQIVKKVKGAMIYPIILVFASIGLILLFGKFILPELSDLMPAESLPLITKFTLLSINFITSIYSLIFILLLIGAFILVRFLLPTDKYRKIKDSIVLKIPVLGSVIKGMVTVRFTRTLYLLIRSGLDIVNILAILKNVISNKVAEECIEASLEAVKRGEKLGAILEKTDFFDSIIVQMISIGEETGELENILGQITEFYEKELEMKIEKLVALVEPVFTLIIGGVIGFIIISIALPMFGMANNLRSGFGM